jgi:hypothetical protein
VIPAPSPLIAFVSASLNSLPWRASSRCLNPRCVPKSTPRPKKSTRKATEIRFKRPTVSAASPVVQIEPITSVISSAAIMRPDRMPMARLSATRMKDRPLA